MNKTVSVFAFILAATLLVGCDENVFLVTHKYPPNCKGHGKIVLAEPIDVYYSHAEAIDPTTTPHHVTRLVCDDGTVALTKD